MKRKRRKRQEESTEEKIGVMDRVLAFIGILLIAFTITMVFVYCRYGGVPDVLCTCVFGACTGELGFMGMIQSFKTKYIQREWDEKDRETREKQEDTQQDETVG